MDDLRVGTGLHFAPARPAGIRRRGRLGIPQRNLHHAVHGLALKTLDLSPATLGLVISVGGIGALFGAVLADRLARRLGMGRALIVCMAGCRLAALLIPAARGPEWFAVSCLVGQQLIGDGLLIGYYVLAVSLRQSVLPTDTLGRANATFHVSAGVLLPVGALLGGAIAAATTVRTALWISVLVGLVNPLILQLSAVRRLKIMPSFVGD